MNQLLCKLQVGLYKKKKNLDKGKRNVTWNLSAAGKTCTTEIAGLGVGPSDEEIWKLRNWEQRQAELFVSKHCQVFQVGNSKGHPLCVLYLMRRCNFQIKGMELGLTKKN